MMRKRVLLAALTAAFVAGSAGVALAQASGAGGGGAAAGGGGDGGSGGGAGGGNSSVGSGTRNNPSPYYKDERFPHR